MKRLKKNLKTQIIPQKHLIVHNCTKALTPSPTPNTTPVVLSCGTVLTDMDTCVTYNSIIQLS